MEAGSRRWAREVAACPHCGRTVMFDGDGVCPACRIAGDAPVTDADRARIAADARRQQVRAAASPRGGGGPTNDLVSGVLTGAFLGVLGLLLASGSRRSETYRTGVTIGLGIQLLFLVLGFLLARLPTA